MLDAMQDTVEQGWTHGELSETFDAINRGPGGMCRSPNETILRQTGSWKGPIDSIFIGTEEDKDRAVEAVIFFAGCVPTVRQADGNAYGGWVPTEHVDPNRGGRQTWWIQAPGYNITLGDPGENAQLLLAVRDAGPWGDQ